MFCQRIDGGARHPSVLVSRSPNQQFQQRGREIDSLLRQPIVDAPAIGLLRFSADNSRGLQPAQTPGQNVGRNALTRALEIFERSQTTNHHVAHDQQRPAVAKDFQRDADRTPRPVLRLGPYSQFRRRYQSRLQNASVFGMTGGRAPMNCSLTPRAASSVGSGGETPRIAGESVVPWQPR